MVQNSTGYTGADLGGGVHGVCNLRFSNTTGILQKKKTMWFIGVEVERETSAPPPKKNLGSAPVVVLPTRRLNSFASSSIFQAFSSVQCDAN